MLKYEYIIKNLSVKQKIALLTNTHEGFEGEIDSLEIPEIVLGELWDANVGENGMPIFPSAVSLANAWSAELFQSVAKVLASQGAKKGTNLFLLPQANALTSMYGKEISEEPYLTGRLVGAMIDGLVGANASACMEAPIVREREASLLDLTPDRSAIYERYQRPFQNALGRRGLEAVFFQGNEAQEYKEINEKTVSVIPDSIHKIYRAKGNDDTTMAIVKETQLLSGSAVAVEAALENYNRIRRSLEEGGATVEELNMAIRDGAAISEDAIDKLLDRRLQLAYSCAISPLSVREDEIEALSVRSALESTVLLKNEKNTLPLKHVKRIALIGGIIDEFEGCTFEKFPEKLATSLENAGIKCVGYAKGYELLDDINEKLIDPALRLADEADLTLLFVGLGKEREGRLDLSHRLHLPANQQALANALHKAGKKVVLVICGERIPDTSVDKKCSAICLAPSQGEGVAQALGEILLGRYNPTARLAIGCYKDQDLSFRETQARKLTKRQKIGGFIGYRYSNACNEMAKYAFGYGLSYSQVEYQAVNINNSSVEIALHNASDRTVCETAQIYVGVNNSLRLRPVRELKSVARATIAPKSTVIVKVSLEDLEIFDTVKNKPTLEDGSYTVYVGPSSDDIRLQEDMVVYGSYMSRADYRYSDYIYSVSNIRSESYTMEAYITPMKNNTTLKTLGILLLAITIFADIIYGISGLILELPFLDYLKLFLILNLVGIALGVLLIVIYSLLHKRWLRKQEEKELQATKELYRGAERVEKGELESLFVKEFETIYQPDDKNGMKASDVRDESTYVYMAVDTDLPAMLSELEAYFKENGLELDSKLLRNIISSIASSRLLLVRSKSHELTEKVIKLLASFLGGKCNFESFADIDTERESLLHSTIYKDTQTKKAFNNATEDKKHPLFVTVEGLTTNNIGDLFTPYVQFFANPSEPTLVNDGLKTVTVQPNTWIVATLKDDQSLDDIPVFVSNLASFIELDATKCEATEAGAPRKPIELRQLEALIFRAKRAHDVDEALWKHIDSLEAFVNERASYHIGNKIFLNLEAYMAVYCELGGAPETALDGAVGSKLMIGILSTLKNNPQMADVDFIQAVESIFGEENVNEIRNIIKNPTLDLSKSAPKEQAPVEQAPVEEAPVEQAPTEEAPVEQAPAEEATKEQAPVEQTSAQEGEEVKREDE